MIIDFKEPNNTPGNKWWMNDPAMDMQIVELL